MAEMVILNKHVVVVIKICAIKLVLITGKLTVLIFLLPKKANPLPLSLRLPPQGNDLRKRLSPTVTREDMVVALVMLK